MRVSLEWVISVLRSNTKVGGWVMSGSLGSGTGIIRLADGAVLKLKIAIVDIKEVGFSPFGGVSTREVPENLKRGCGR